VVDNVFVALKSKEEGHNFKGALRLLGIVWASGEIPGTEFEELDF
jgi:hypothetical protein